MNLPNGKVGVAYNASILLDNERKHYNANGITHVWEVEYPYKDYGTLPDGLTLSSDGIISGTPTTAGSFQFVAMAIRNENGRKYKVHGSATIIIEP